MQLIAADVTRSMFCICLYVGHTHGLCKNRCHLGAGSCGPKNYVLDRVQILLWEGTILRGIAELRVPTTPGNPGNILEFKNPGNPGNLLEFNGPPGNFCVR